MAISMNDLFSMIYSYSAKLMPGHQTEMNSDKETPQPEAVPVAAAFSNTEATHLKFQENEALRKGMEQKRKLQLFDKVFASTKEAHEQIHELPFIQTLSEGTFSPLLFQQYLKNLECVFVALKTAEKKIISSDLGHFVMPELWREYALKTDIISWAVKEQQPSSEALGYAEYLIQLSTSDHERLLAHMFVNYGGVLFGGQRLKYSVEGVYSKWIYENTNKKPQERGSSFYTVSDPVKFKREWIKRFNEMPSILQFDDIKKENFEEKLVQESKEAFRRITEMIMEMDGGFEIIEKNA